ncbi:MAG: exodeoxyribonuclease VII small subunit [Gammaproteobacteria bacterium RIFCSPHIGHO2_12_FULL_35_23]|nr:MAG: exodeoxyribonuclease VII small subunit [Gammaproteobacteria bacterium RIFCSPHIGHO2_12_FULL_35_23]
MAKEKTAINLEKSLQMLEQLVEKMEQGNLDLESSMKLFEQGVSLVKQCQTTLAQAEQKVQILTESNGEKSLCDFKEEE